MDGSSYAYDGAGNRISQTVGVDVTQYLLDLQPGLATVLQATQNSDTTRYIHAQRGIHAQQDASDHWTWMLQDGLGSVRSVVDDSLSVLESRLYEPYGTPFGTNGTSQTVYGFTGEPVDENELVYLRARYYAPNLGVFTGLDPFEGMAQRPMSLNGYSWVEGNVINRVDPQGTSANVPRHVQSSCNNSSLGCYDLNLSAEERLECLRNPEQFECTSRCREQWFPIAGQSSIAARLYMQCVNECNLRLEDQLTQHAIALRDMALAGTITDLEVLARTADYGCELGLSTGEITSQLSRIFVGTDQWTALSLVEGLVDGVLNPGGEPITHGLAPGISPFGNNNSGLHPDYDDGRNQLFHFVPYMSSVAHGGLLSELLALIGNYVHEDLGFPDFSNGASWQDENLAYAGMAIGADIWRGNVPACQLGNYIRSALSAPVPNAIGNRSTIPDQYPWIALCRVSPNDYWCRPSVPYPR